MVHHLEFPSLLSWNSRLEYLPLLYTLRLFHTPTRVYLSSVFRVVAGPTEQSTTYSCCRANRTVNSPSESLSVSRSCRANRTVNYLLLMPGQPNSHQSFRVFYRSSSRPEVSRSCRANRTVSYLLSLRASLP